ncbi:13962_t:CDS:1, partial [Gigaspora rosea]
MNSLLTGFTFRKITFFSFLQLVAASIVDESYSSNQDLFDAILNTLFPITFVLLFKVKEKPKSIRNKLLPLLDDILYNIVTWGIPLIVSFAYEDSLAIKIFSI